MYEYQATVIRVVDGDTAWLRLDLGLNVRLDTSVRFFGINAPELNTDEGKAARDFLCTYLQPGTVVTLNTIKDSREKYGRYLGILTLNGVNINQLMVDSGHAVTYKV